MVDSRAHSDLSRFIVKWTTGRSRNLNYCKIEEVENNYAPNIKSTTQTSNSIFKRTIAPRVALGLRVFKSWEGNKSADSHPPASRSPLTARVKGLRSWIRGIPHAQRRSYISHSQYGLIIHSDRKRLHSFSKVAYIITFPPYKYFTSKRRHGRETTHVIVLLS